MFDRKNIYTQTTYMKNYQYGGCSCTLTSITLAVIIHSKFFVQGPACCTIMRFHVHWVHLQIKTFLHKSLQPIIISSAILVGTNCLLSGFVQLLLLSSEIELTARTYLQSKQTRDSSSEEAITYLEIHVYCQIPFATKTGNMVLDGINLAALY